MKMYEAVCIFRAEDDKYSAARDAVRNALVGLEAKDLKEEDMQIRSLAYPIEKQYQGHYYLYVFGMDPEKAKEVENAVRLIPDLMRILVTRKED
jgi:small subunit ribosomal protein S6